MESNIVLSTDRKRSWQRATPDNVDSSCSTTDKYVRIFNEDFSDGLTAGFDAMERVKPVYLGGGRWGWVTVSGHPIQYMGGRLVKTKTSTQ